MQSGQICRETRQIIRKSLIALVKLVISLGVRVPRHHGSHLIISNRCLRLHQRAVSKQRRGQRMPCSNHSLLGLIKLGNLTILLSISQRSLPVSANYKRKNTQDRVKVSKGRQYLRVELVPPLHVQVSLLVQRVISSHR